MKHLLFRIRQFFWFTSDDGLSHFERKRIGREYAKEMIKPPSPEALEALRQWRERKNS